MASPIISPQFTSPKRNSNTPISNKMAGSETYCSSTAKHDSETRFRLAEETQGLFLGPMPCQQFLDTFLPLAPNVGPRPAAEGVFGGVPFKKLEAHMIQPFVRIGNCTDVHIHSLPAAHRF